MSVSLLQPYFFMPYRSIIHLCIYSFLAKRVEDPSNLVISWTRKTDLNVTEMHDLHR
jgi:hypothetical protein